MLRLAMFGCSHLGYAPAGLRRTTDAGINVIAADGYRAHRQVIADIAAGAQANPEIPTVIIDGGDLFHTPRPSNNDIAAALNADKQRPASLERFSIPGNHDRTTSTATPATAVLAAREGLHITAPGTGLAPAERTAADDRLEVVVDGLYDIWELTGSDGEKVFLHMVNEQALAPAAEDMDPKVDPSPVDGGVNILVTHGIVPDPETNGALLYHHGVDERGGERVIPRDWFSRGFTAFLLSDLHTPHSGAVDGTLYAYTGSLIRRGFSDAESARGYMVVDVAGDSSASLGLGVVPQRPYIDETVDATGLDPEAAVLQVTDTLRGINGEDPETAERTGDGGVRVRLTVTGLSEEALEEVSSNITSWNRRAVPGALSVQVRAVGDGQPHCEDVSDALGSLPDLTEESLSSALHRMAEEGRLKRLNDLSPENRTKVLELCDHALPAETDD